MNAKILQQQRPVIHPLAPMIAFQLVLEVTAKVAVLMEVIRKQVTQRVRHSQKRRFQKNMEVLLTRIAM